MDLAVAGFLAYGVVVAWATITCLYFLSKHVKKHGLVCGDCDNCPALYQFVVAIFLYLTIFALFIFDETDSAALFLVDVIVIGILLSLMIDFAGDQARQIRATFNPEKEIEVA